MPLCLPCDHAVWTRTTVRITLHRPSQQKCLLPVVRRMQSQARDPSTRSPFSMQALSWCTSTTACKMRLGKRISIWLTNRCGQMSRKSDTWEERRLSNTQTEPHGHKTAKAGRSGRGRGDAGPDADPEGHVQRWSDFGQDHIARNLHEDVASIMLVLVSVGDVT